MKTTLYLNGKKVTKKHMVECLGKERVDAYIKSAEQQYRQDPFVQNDFMIGGGVLTIQFE
jgi:hypothetical protein